MMKLKAIWFAVLSATVFFPGMPSRAENPVKASPDKFSLAVECVKRGLAWRKKALALYRVGSQSSSRGEVYQRYYKSTG